MSPLPDGPTTNDPRDLAEAAELALELLRCYEMAQIPLVPVAARQALLREIDLHLGYTIRHLARFLEEEEAMRHMTLDELEAEYTRREVRCNHCWRTSIAHANDDSCNFPQPDGTRCRGFFVKEKKER